MRQVDKNSPGIIKKSTRYMSNAPEVLDLLSKRCTGGHQPAHHALERQSETSSSVSTRPDLCKAICTGIKSQIKEEQGVTMNSFVNGKHWDDVRGGWLDPRLVAEARAEEMEYIHKHTLWRLRSIFLEVGFSPIF